jgi:hypothetical protein
MKKNSYSVNVGNIGNMDYTSKKLALECFNTYVTLSKSGEGRAAGESVYLFCDGEIIAEHIGTVDQEQPLSDNTKAIVGDIRRNIGAIIKDANSNTYCKGYGIIFGNFSINIPPADQEQFWEELEEIQQEHNIYFSVNDYNDLVVETEERESED